ncbi:serine/arginine repetitive matrix protein 1-like [Elephas maximus indicus]|uniref:serine/arginine repetitive matrix protein 1-like n=1 Tax=Elephas maximus indicus TaxID=99487 RepID=UPI0021168DE7|nr:serine/arginine repetitive matrix protein 1-like [Elephas maximus indicus]
MQAWPRALLAPRWDKTAGGAGSRPARRTKPGLSAGRGRREPKRRGACVAPPPSRRRPPETPDPRTRPPGPPTGRFVAE